MTLDTVNRLPLEQVRSFIDDLDFGPVFDKLVRTDVPTPYSLPWDPAAAVHAIHRYRNFLFLWRKYKYESEETVDIRMPPPPDVDEVWHAHILDTRRYARDCVKLFGTFHHHYPYFGIDGDRKEMDMEEILAALDPVRELYEKEFSEPMTIGMPGDMDPSAPS